MKVLEIKNLPSFIEVTVEITKLSGWFSRKNIQCKYYLDDFSVYTIVNGRPEKLCFGDAQEIISLYNRHTQILDDKETEERLIHEIRGN